MLLLLLIPFTEKEAVASTAPFSFNSALQIIFDSRISIETKMATLTEQKEQIF